MSRPSTTNLYPPSTAHTIYPASSLGNTNSRTLTLWIHDPDASAALSRHDAVLNYDLFPPGVAKPGDIAEVQLISHVTNAPGSNLMSDSHASDTPTANSGRKGSYSGSVAATADDDKSRGELLKGGEEEGKVLLVIKELEESQRRLGVQVRGFPAIPE